MRARRRYRLPERVAWAAVALAMTVPAGLPARAEPPDAPRPGGAPGGAPDRTAGGSGTVPERVTRLALGDFDAPAPGARLSAAVPAGAEPHARARSGRAGPERARSGRAGPERARSGRARTLVLSRPVTPGFSAIGVTWAAGGPDGVSVTARVRRSGAWTAWRVAGAAEPGRGDGASAGAGPVPRGGASAGAGLVARDGAELMWWGPADGVEVAVTAPVGGAPRDVVLDLIDPGRLPGDAAAAATPPAGAGSADPNGGPAASPNGGPAAGPNSGPAPGAAGAAGVLRDGAAAPTAAASPYLRPRVRRPAIVRRSGWGANERKMRWTPEYVAYLKAGTVHHTATTNRYSRGQVPRILRAIYHFHAVSRGWGDIGYNVLVDRFGRLWEGRAGGLSRPVVGAHSGGYNSYTTGVSFIGDHRNRAVPARAREAAARFLAWKFSLSPSFDPRGRTRLTGGGSTSKYPPGTTIRVYRIHGHRRTNATTCPGARGVAALRPLRRRTMALMGRWIRPTARRTRLTYWRPTTSTWYAQGGAAIRGRAGDVPLVGDFDGDGTPDLTTWTPTTGIWTIRYSARRGVARVRLGGPGHRPTPADTDGDGRTEPMTWDPATGRWHRRGRAALPWTAQPGDVPVPADYSGDGRADIAVWRPSTGTWHIRGAEDVTLGDPWHVPVPADYDGDGAVDPATWSPNTGRLLVHGRRDRVYGQVGDVPLPGQYDGDAPADLAVWRVVDGRGRWIIDGVGTYAVGTQGDQPIPAG